MKLEKKIAQPMKRGTRVFSKYWGISRGALKEAATVDARYSEKLCGRAVRINGNGYNPTSLGVP
jgi:hypothetical protein